jgi:hypothetical protein
LVKCSCENVVAQVANGMARDIARKIVQFAILHSPAFIVTRMSHDGI